MTEHWKTIANFEAYEVSDLGRVRRRLPGGSGAAVVGKLLKPRPDPKGYLKVVLCRDGEHSKKVHRLVAEAFIPNPLNLPQVNHKRGNKADNRALKLEWRSNLGNMQHAVSLGLAGEDITYRRDQNKWRVRYRNSEGKRVSAGQFNTKEAAEKALKVALKSVPHIV
jgi:hypothetical protein